MKFTVSPEFLGRLRQQVKIWQIGGLPGLVVVGCVAIARFSGVLQPLEWSLFDTFLRWRPLEKPDVRVVIVGINASDINAVGRYPLPDGTLAELLNTIQRYQPRAIALDIFRNVKNGEGRPALAKAFKQFPNLVGIEAALSDDTDLQVKPPPELPPERVGFVDTLPDADGKLRRSLLAFVAADQVRSSLPLRVVELYLRQEGVPLRYDGKPGEPIRFGQVRLPRFEANTGGYVRAEAGGTQTLINFRNHPQPFPVVSMLEVLRGEVPEAVMRDRIVLIGITDSNSSNDTYFTSATQGTLLANALGTGNSAHYQLLYGIEHHAHVVSQMISAVLDGRSLLRSWPEGLDYLWLLLWGVGGMSLGLLLQSPWKTLVGIGLGSGVLGVICYGYLILGWWLPVVPALLSLWGAGLTTFFFDQRSKTLLEQRERVLQQTYDAVHNGPLQTLAAMLRGLGDEPVPVEPLRSRLQTLNQELRAVYESMYQAVHGDEQYAQTPIADLLYQVYEATLQRDFPGFVTVLSFIPPDFSVLAECVLTADQKRSLCLFLEEALCNVGKHAIAATRLDVVCLLEKKQYILRIADNGKGSFPQAPALAHGRGTEQALELARRLNGTFQRRSQSPHGTVCELIWKPRTERRFWRQPLWSRSVAAILQRFTQE